MRKMYTLFARVHALAFLFCQPKSTT
jgi:hypothetical protein